MALDFNKNTILYGPVDFFCLVCETNFTTVAGIEEHVTKSTHINNLDLAKNVSELNDDCIKKIKSRYYCELCNKAFPVLTRVRLHISEPMHINNKSSRAVKRCGEHIIAFDKIIIKEDSWNGLHDNSCVICDKEYEIEFEHKNLTSHIINMIQMKVEFDENKNIYRKVDEKSFQCLTCNIVETLQSLYQHFDCNDHKAFYNAAQINYDELMKPNCKKILSDKEMQSKCVESDHSDKDKNYKEKIENPKSVFDDKVQICDKTRESEKIELKNQSCSNNSKPVVSSESAETMTIPSDSTYIYDSKAEERICRVLETNNYIVRYQNNKLFCIVCDWEINNTNTLIVQLHNVDYIKQHLGSHHHQKLLKIHLLRLKELKNKSDAKYYEKQSLDAIINKSRIQDDMPIFRKNRIKIDYDNKIVVCKKCSLDLEFDYKVIHSHIIEHNVKEEYIKFDESRQIEDVNHNDRVTEISNNKSVTVLNDEIKSSNQKETIVASNKQIITDNKVESLKEKEVVVVCSASNEDGIKTSNKKNKVEAVDNASSKDEIISSNKEIMAMNELKSPNEKGAEATCIASNKDKIEASNKGNKRVNRVGSRKEKEAQAVSSASNKVKLLVAQEIKTLNEENMAMNKVESPKHKGKTEAVFSSSSNDNNRVPKDILSQNIRDKDELVRTSTWLYIETLIPMESIIFNDLVINNKICINQLSFSFMQLLDLDKKSVKCFACDEIVLFPTFKSHYEITKHVAFIKNAPVIHIESEFIREMLPSKYHCGYCNHFEKSWQDMEIHLESVCHKESKTNALWRLEQYKTELARDAFKTDDFFEKIFLSRNLP